MDGPRRRLAFVRWCPIRPHPGAPVAHRYGGPRAGRDGAARAQSQCHVTFVRSRRSHQPSGFRRHAVRRRVSDGEGDRGAKPARRPDASRRRADRGLDRGAPGGAAILRSRDRPGEDVRGSGGDRDRERAALQRDERGARARDGDGGGAPRHRAEHIRDPTGPGRGHPERDADRGGGERFRL